MTAVLEKKEGRLPAAQAESFSQTLERIKTKQITVGVVGLGYVGFPLSLVFAEAGVPVVGFDIDHEKIEALEQGRSYIRHIDPERLAGVKKDKRFKATDRFEHIA